MSRLGYAINHHLDQRCTLTKRVLTGANADGQPTRAYPVAVTGVRCRLVVLSEEDVAGNLIAFVHHLMVMPAVPLDVGDRIAAILEADGALYDDGPFIVEERLIRHATNPELRVVRIARVG